MVMRVRSASLMPAGRSVLRTCDDRLRRRSILVQQRVTDRLYPDQAITEHKGVDAVLDPRRGGVSGPLQEEHVVLIDLCFQIPSRIRHIGEQLSERRPDSFRAAPDA